MKKILITRKLLRSCEDKAKETFEANIFSLPYIRWQFCKIVIERQEAGM